jgi:REP element-mobilizing transposase RayT
MGAHDAQFTDLHRRSIRLRDYDYSQGGAYFVTICARHRACLFGDVIGDGVELTTLGCIVEDEWLRTPAIRPQVTLDAYVIMPNHFHAVLFIDGDRAHPVRAYCNTPLHKNTPADHVPSLRSPSQTIGAIVRGFK